MAAENGFSDALCVPLGPPPNFLFVGLVLALPHILYAWIWFKPHVWRYWFKHRSVEVFAFCGAVGKVIQFSMAIFWFGANRPNGLCIDLNSISILQMTLSLPLLIFGQALNMGIYKAIGKVGVYYGFKLGHKVPWVNGFPFNVVSHPQYVGSVMSVWGLTIFLMQQAPNGIIQMASYWSSLYLITGWIEQYC